MQRQHKQLQMPCVNDGSTFRNSIVSVVDSSLSVHTIGLTLFLMMLEKTQRKLLNIRQSLLVGEKYVSKFDALSISIIEIDEQNHYSTELPRMEGMRSLANDINNVLNEAYIEQQQPLSELRLSLSECKKISEEVLADMKHGNSNDHSSIDPEQFLDTMKQTSSSFTLSKTLDKQLRPKLIEIYETVSSVIDAKFSMLEQVQDITDYYVRTVVAVAAGSSVLRAEDKVNYITRPHFSPLLTHRLFNSAEEQELLSTVRHIWSVLVLGGDELSELAERQLAKNYFTKFSKNADWWQYIKIGVIAVLLMWSISECFNNERKGAQIWDDPTFAIFMCFGDFLLLLIMWGVSMSVWKSHGIDFIRLLALEETELANAKDPSIYVYESSSSLVIIFLVTFILFNKMVRHTAASTDGNLALAHALPICLVLFFIARIVLPWQSRSRWLHMLWRVLAAPHYQVIFRDGYIGDLLTSLVRVLIPLSFSFTYLGVSVYAWLSNDMALASSTNTHWWKDTIFFRSVLIPFLTLLPLWLRLVQCLRRSVESGKRWPHIGNALKYTSAIVVISYGTFQPEYRRSASWVGAFVFATLFQFAWDLTQDWGMLEIILPTRNKYEKASEGYLIDYLSQIQFRLRAQRLLGPVWVYLLVIAGNLILRFAWTLTLLPNNISAAKLSEMSPLYIILTTHVGPLIAAGEILRRMVWGFYRLEWEQLEVLARQREQLETQREEEAVEDGQTNGEGEDNYIRDSDSNEKTKLEMEMMNKIPFEKMDTVTTLESHSFDLPINLPTSSDLFETDWTLWFPSYVRKSIYSLSVLGSQQPFEKKLRLVEAVIFAGVVAYLIVCAAIPSFSNQNGTLVK